MPKVITFSRAFPASHANAGTPTWFVERIWHGLRAQFDNETLHLYIDPHDKELWDINRVNWFSIKNIAPKIHTIRAGRTRKAGDVFSPRVWSGAPRKSKQVQFAPDITIHHVVDFERTAGGHILLNGIDATFDKMKIAENDGLTLGEFEAWFSEPFIGQIVIWEKENPYSKYCQ